MRRTGAGDGSSTGWVRLVALTPEQRVAHAFWVVGPLFVLGFGLFEIAGYALPDAALWQRVLLGISSLAVASLLVAGSAVFFQRGIFVDAARSRVRVGGKVVAIPDIDRARFVKQGTDEDTMLVFGRESGPQARILLSADPERELDGASRERLIALLGASGIRMPTSKYDPSGRFAHYNFPENLTRDEAIALVNDPAAAHARYMRDVVGPAGR